MKITYERVESIVGKGDNAGYHNVFQNFVSQGSGTWNGYVKSKLNQDATKKITTSLVFWYRVILGKKN